MLIVIYVALAGAVIAICVMLKRMWYMVTGVKVTAVRENDDPGAKERFLDTLDKARDSFVAYDDGDFQVESVYNDENVVVAIRRKLDEYPDFKMTYFFNRDDQDARRLHFRASFAAEPHPRVEIRVRPDGTKRPKVDKHYRVADQGRMADVSWHEEQDKKRRYRLYDLMAVPDEAFGGASRTLLQSVYRSDYLKKLHGTHRPASLGGTPVWPVAA